MSTQDSERKCKMEEEYSGFQASSSKPVPKIQLTKIIDLLFDDQKYPVKMSAEEVFLRSERISGAIDVTLQLDVDKWRNTIIRDNWVKDLDNLKLCSKRPQTFIGICGEMGAGKSSLINAILEMELLPTSGMEACTAAVTEIAYHDKSTIDARVTFIPKEEWISAISEVKSALRDRSNEDPDANTEQHGIEFTETERLDTETSLPRKARAVWDKVKKKHISATDADEFSGSISRYLASVDDDEHDHAVWPLVYRVKIFLNSDCLRTGAVLVDLPGLGDVNSARSAVATSYMKKCTLIWIVAPIQRAVDNKIALDLMGHSFRTQLLSMFVSIMSSGALVADHDHLLCNGIYNDRSIAFIATKSDDVNPKELVKRLKLDKDSGFLALQQQITALEKQKKQLEKAIKDRASDLQNIQDGITSNQDALVPHKRKYTTLTGKPHSNKKQRVQEESETLVTEMVDDADANVNSELSSLSPLSSGSEDDDMDPAQEAQRALAVAQQNLADVEVKCLQNDTELQSAQKKRKIWCALQRSKLSCNRLKEQFCQGLKETQGSLNQDVDDTDLPVFACSSNDYLRLTGRSTDGSPACYEEASQTGIPDVQTWLIQATRKEHERAAKSFLKLTQLFIRGVRTRLLGVDGITLDERNELRDTLAIKMQGDSKCSTIKEQLLHDFANLRLTMEESLEERFRDGLERRAKEGASLARMAAIPACEHLVDRKTMHWQTFLAVMRHNGSFGAHDFNMKLADPLTQNVVQYWARTFSDVEFESLKEGVEGSLEKIISLVAYAAPTTIAKHVETQGEHCRDQVNLDLQNLIDAVVQEIRAKSKEISRSLALWPTRTT
ncbi:hypothetical protein D9758_007953 [Tetrapyrgos nigripes]|uniref:Dynamin N-terminal domain-containing protein n=1 Tax=Tetrapyrgos nigripes TaxID=182062 RepID=A0A8H5D3T4_9AGAR|nr:hypothetical protein D9758_007953 [Tetrapyrgos nigripes]